MTLPATLVAMPVDAERAAELRRVKWLATGVLASDAPGSLTAFNNRGVDFTNRAADLNPEDIESLVVLKGPEASALYGIDAANGARFQDVLAFLQKRVQQG